jgi:FMN phosphatase YigB (HAD superfamily)
MGVVTRGLVVSFDLDGTLVHGPLGIAMRAITEGWGDGAQAESLAEHARRLAGPQPLGAYDWSGILAGVAARRGAVFDGDLVAPLERAIAEHGVGHVHADTRRHLAALRARGARVVVLTNGRREFQGPVLAGAGLLDLVDALVTSDDVGAIKPAAAMFEAARNGAARHVHVGDRLDHDVAGARAAGATGILLRPDAPGPADARALAAFLRRVRRDEGGTGAPVEPDVVLRELAGLVRYVAALP